MLINCEDEEEHTLKRTWILHHLLEIMSYGPCCAYSMLTPVFFYIHTFLFVQFAFKVRHYPAVLVAANFFLSVFFLTDFPASQKLNLQLRFRTVAATRLAGNG